MPKKKWEQFHKNNSKSLDNQNPFVEYFKEHVVEHLKKEHDPHGEINQPGKIIQEAKQSVGTLSRIFDAFPFPVPSYDYIKIINEQPNGLREYMQENLDEILPLLLNKERTALNQKIIEAIGEQNYQEILKNSSAKEVAIQLVKAVFVSYGQRLLDSIDKDNLNLQKEAYQTVLPVLEGFSKELTLNGLPKQAEKMKLSDLQAILLEFKELLLEAKQVNIVIPKIEVILGQLDTASTWLDPSNEDTIHLQEEIKTDKALSCYNNAVDRFVNEAKTVLANNPAKPEEVHWFKKILRFLTGNEKFLQNADEKRYEQQTESLFKLNALNAKINSIQEDNKASSELEQGDEQESEPGSSMRMN